MGGPGGAAVRLTLRDYQEEALQRVAAAEGRGVRAQLGVAATGLGKALADSEPVLTPSGWRPIGALAVGDLVIGADGLPTEVVGVFPQGVRPAYEVEFSDGPVVRCDGDHLWAARTKHDRFRKRPWRNLTTTQLAAAGLHDGQGGRRWEVPVPKPAQMPAADLPLDPYLLGLLLGDGGLSVPGRVLLHTDDDLVATVELPAPARWSRLADCGKTAGTWIIGGPTGRGANPVLAAVRAVGLEGLHATEKFVPSAYMHAPEADRLAVLQGLMDADGHVRPKDGHVELTLANPRLAHDAAMLARSLGGTAKVVRRPTGWVHRGEARVGQAWRVSMAMPVCPFRWERKAKVWRPRTKYQPRRAVVGITQRGVAEMVCIKVAAADGLFVTRGYVVTHNTVMFCALAERRGKRTLVLAHRDELVSQAEAKVREVWPEAYVGVVKAERNEVRADVVVASVQTLARPNRLAQLMAPWSGATLLGVADPFDLVVVDEAHHTAADSYRGILTHLRAGVGPTCAGCSHAYADHRPDDTPAVARCATEGCQCQGMADLLPAGPLLLGVTATPDRGDGKGLDDLFTEVVFSYDLLWGIRAGYLADLRGRRVKVANLDMTQVRTRHGDYDQGQAGRAMEAAGVQHNVVAAWQAEAADRRTLVFTPTVEVARLVAEEFRHHGVAADYVHGGTPLPERRAMLARFQAGELQVLANCAVLTEGFDAPRTDCIVVARPTKSRALYAQMVGRGTRRHPDKADCLVLDVVGASALHTLVTVPSLFGLEDAYAERMGDGTGNLADVVQERDDELVRVGRMRAEEADLFRKVRTKGVAWVAVHRAGEPLRRYVRELGKAEDGAELPTVVLAQRAEGDVWTAGLWWMPGKDRPEAKQVLMAEVPLETAQGVAEDYVRKHGGRALTDADARWRKGKPSAKALDAAKRWRMPKPEQYATAGELSDAMGAHIARIRARKAKPKAEAPA